MPVSIISAITNGTISSNIASINLQSGPNINCSSSAKDTESFAKDFSLVSKTIDILEVNNGFYAQSKTQPSQYQNYSNSTPPKSNGSGIGIQGGRF